MKAVGYQKSLPVTDKNVLLDIELPKPEAAGRDLLVKVESISVNPVDTKIRKRVQPEHGSYQVLGWDAAGTVESVGGDVTLFKPGDKVWYAGAINRPGSNSEYHLVDERIVALKPESLDFAQAAALPLTSITAWEILFDRLLLAKESKGKLLIIGAAGGVGSIMIQLAKSLTSLDVIATASREESRAWVTSLGADYVIDHSQPLLPQLESINKSDIEYVVSLTHTGDYLSQIVDLIAPQGKLALIDDPDVLDIMPFKRKSVSVHWELMFTRSLFETEDMIEQHKLLTSVAKMVDAGTIKTTLTNQYGLICAENLIRAHALLESDSSRGKIVLTGF
ncbi:zinc-binding alcohol dehydrogenase family protein [Teredinibacter sp. KSP-S5-2]|uniref:zinc-binding alcohol dehydrogenase family protein n=1 Tax=Teredinibacter sp. KSP-S5-2 TaxID=3034506 RepID=UPI002934A350|nr:zinc-binding alcohol dehydrogenase family protein [Teredinibacter sp. KSP-S5-2]WNO11535.1 zinc-binding alcohol dehydrogenase family protein [Teredinibacter sp. KSP-S5-2]